MKIDANGPVFPHHGIGMFGEPITHVPGMTYRQWLVGTIAAGISANQSFVDVSHRDIAEQSVWQADAVIAELNREESK